MSAQLCSQSDEAEEIATKSLRPRWRRRPTEAAPAVGLSVPELNAKIDNYFEKRYDKGEHPTFCDLAGETGFDSIDQLINHARRQGAPAMRSISRALLAVGAGYEEQAQQGSRVALAMLEYLPQFDTEEHPTQIPTHPFHAKHEVQVNLTGLERPDQKGATLTAQQAYLQLIRHKTYEEVEEDVLETIEADDGEYTVLDIQPDEDEITE